MRTVRRVLLAGLLGALTALVLAASTAATPPGSDYAWAQPGTAPVSVPFAQPPAWIPIVCAWVCTPPGSDYAWAQPGTAPVSVPHAQPPGR